MVKHYYFLLFYKFRLVFNVFGKMGEPFSNLINKHFPQTLTYFWNFYLQYLHKFRFLVLYWFFPLAKARSVKCYEWSAIKFPWTFSNSFLLVLFSFIFLRKNQVFLNKVFLKINWMFSSVTIKTGVITWISHLNESHMKPSHIIENQIH